MAKLRGFHLYVLTGAMTAATIALAASLVPTQSMHTAFVAENDLAMSKMMHAMHAKPSGNIDRDFATMMIPHHQGAIDMAQAELRYGSDPQLRRLAQEIIVEQQQEIRVMQMALESPALGSQTPAARQ